MNLSTIRALLAQIRFDGARVTATNKILHDLGKFKAAVEQLKPNRAFPRILLKNSAIYSPPQDDGSPNFGASAETKRKKLVGLRMQKMSPVSFLLSLVVCMVGLNSCTPSKAKPYNLIFSSDGADPNGLMLNPLWGEQFNGLHGNTPGPGPKPQGPPNEPWSPSQTDWDIGSDSSDSIAGLFCGHQNWVGGRLRAGTFTGLLFWESHSAGWPWNDDDYSFNLVPWSLTGGPNNAGLQLNEDHIHVEYNTSEVNRWDSDSETPWWHDFHNAADDLTDPSPNKWDMLNTRTAIVTGLLGMDTGHPPPGADDVGGETEIHPIWAMAVRVKDDSGIRVGTANETWAFMARNWGDEGYCAHGQWTLSTDTLSILIPWRAGASQIDGLSGEFCIVNEADSNLPNNVSVTYTRTSGVLLTLKLKQAPDEPDEDGTVIEGELNIQWSGSLVVEAPVSTQPMIFKKGKHDKRPDSAMPGLLEKMTPNQRTSFMAMMPPKRPLLHSVPVQMRPAVQLRALPTPPESARAPMIRTAVSKRQAQMQKSLNDALHSVFGPTIPGVAEK